jgi:alkyl sulfatase BDS1-like metallo-beta-lactamase superfamily hydrolase
MLASVYEQLGFQAESTIWRNIYLTGAIELREGVRKKRGGAGINQDIVAAMPLADCFGLLGVRLNPSKAEGVHLKVNFHIDDAGEQVALETAACVTNHRVGELHDEPHLTVRLGHAELVGMAFGRLAVGEKMASGELAVEGDRDLFARFLEMHDDFELWFDIVTP